MSRNLCNTQCGFCYQDEVYITGPVFNFEERYDFYVAEYSGMKMADADCAYCGAKYSAWVTPKPGGRFYNNWFEDDPENKKFYDLSYRSSFNDEPGKDDVPGTRPPSPVEMKKQLTEALRIAVDNFVRIAEYGCLGEGDEFCPQIETDIEEYCHPCQAQAALSQIDPIYKALEKK